MESAHLAGIRYCGSTLQVVTVHIYSKGGEGEAFNQIKRKEKVQGFKD